MLTYVLLLTAMKGCQTGVVCLVLCGHQPQSKQTGKCRQNIFPACNADSTCSTPHVPKLVAHDSFRSFAIFVSVQLYIQCFACDSFTENVQCLLNFSASNNTAPPCRFLTWHVRTAATKPCYVSAESNIVVPKFKLFFFSHVPSVVLSHDVPALVTAF